jgi:hypothetical protein
MIVASDIMEPPIRLKLKYIKLVPPKGAIGKIQYHLYQPYILMKITPTSLSMEPRGHSLGNLSLNAYFEKFPCRDRRIGTLQILQRGYSQKPSHA